jgi:hypothetical protein
LALVVVQIDVQSVNRRFLCFHRNQESVRLHRMYFLPDGKLEFVVTLIDRERIGRHVRSRGQHFKFGDRNKVEVRAGDEPQDMLRVIRSVAREVSEFAVDDGVAPTKFAEFRRFVNGCAAFDPE